MAKAWIEQLVESEDGFRLYQQERTILEVTELICHVMKDEGVNRSRLAELLKKTKGRVSQLLEGGANMTLQTVCDVFTVLGKQLKFYVVPLNHGTGEMESPTLIESLTWKRPEAWQPDVHYALCPTNAGEGECQYAATLAT